MGGADAIASEGGASPGPLHHSGVGVGEVEEFEAALQQRGEEHWKSSATRPWADEDCVVEDGGEEEEAELVEKDDEDECVVRDLQQLLQAAVDRRDFAATAELSSQIGVIGHRIELRKLSGYRN